AQLAARKLAAAGVPAELRVWPGQVHRPLGSWRSAPRDSDFCVAASRQLRCATYVLRCADLKYVFLQRV
ncbi:hypothetical protein PJN30_22955, partial [Mycobacterium kansasii]